MLIDYNIDELNQALNDFKTATGINIALFNNKYESITELHNNCNFCNYLQQQNILKNKCHHSDLKLIEKCKNTRKLEKHICYAGLVDATVPIIKDDNILGYIMLGQMRKDTEFEDIYKNIFCANLDKSILKDKYEKLIYCDSEKIESIANIAIMLMEYILFKNMLKPNYNINLNNVIKYIDDNFNKDITIEKICKETCISKSVLYRDFKINFNCTVGEYINSKRIKKAKEMMISGVNDIKLISETVGYTNYTYFFKIFKKLSGVTPHKFIKNNTLKENI